LSIIVVGPAAWPRAADAADAMAEMNAHVMAVRTPIVIMSPMSEDASVA
jgi:hypothetical protein